MVFSYPNISLIQTPLGPNVLTSCCKNMYIILVMCEDQKPLISPETELYSSKPGNKSNA